MVRCTHGRILGLPQPTCKIMGVLSLNWPTQLKTGKSYWKPISSGGMYVQIQSMFSVYRAHFYISMKGRAILGPPLGPHKLSNIYASPLEVVWWRTVELLRSNSQKNICCRRGEPLPNVEQLPNSDPVLSKRDWSLGLIESQLNQCKCIVKLRTVSYSNGKQLVRS